MVVASPTVMGNRYVPKRYGWRLCPCVWSSAVKALVTGGAGFIGSHIVDALVERGWSVRVLDDLSSGRRENLTHLDRRIEFIQGDIRDRAIVERSVGGVEVVFHQAALRSVPKSFDNPSLYNDVNVSGTLTVLMAARAAGVRRVVVASSSSVYGDTERLPQRESDPAEPISFYAASKLACELYCRVFSGWGGLETVALRYFNVFGPRQSLENRYAVVVPKFIVSLLRNEPPPINGDGSQSRDFTYVTNVVAANLLAGSVAGVSGRVFNIAAGEGYTVLEVAQRLNKILGKAIAPVHLAERPGDVRRTRADITQAASLLGFQPEVDFEEGLQRTAEWFREHQS